VRSLTAHGVEVVFGIPGTHNLPIYDHLVSYGLRHVTPRHEQGAGYAADGYARVTGKPGVCLVTSGPGVTNIATAAANAYHDSIPLLIISPGMASDSEGRDTGYLHEAKALSRAMDSLVHWSRRVGSADEAQETLCAAFRHFATERPRPVHVEIPLDVFFDGRTTRSVPVFARSLPLPSGDGRTRVVPTDLLDTSASQPHGRGQRPELQQAAAAIGLLAGARRPGMILGGGAVGAAEEATRLAERIDAVVVTTCNGKGTVSEGHPLSVGCALRFAAVREELAACDVVVAVGTELGESDLWGPPLELPGVVVRIDIDPDQLEKNLPVHEPGRTGPPVAGRPARQVAPQAARTPRGYPGPALRPHVGIVGDAAQVLGELLIGLGEASPSADTPGRERAEEVRRRIQEERRAEAAPYMRLHEILADVLDDGAIIAGDSSRVTYFGTVSLFSVDRPRRLLYSMGFSTLGYGIPAAVGAKIGRPSDQVVALVGDGAAMFSIAEVAMASELRLSLPIIVVNDGGYGQIRESMRARGSPRIGVDLESPDFAALGRAFGGEGVALERIDDLAGALRAALSRDRPTIIELRMEG
jgi:acetolactate synthase-1/2/3 large subunit